MIQQVTIVNSKIIHSKLQNFEIEKLEQKSFLNAFLAAFSKISDFSSYWDSGTNGGFIIVRDTYSGNQATNELKEWLSGAGSKSLKPELYTPPMSNDIIFLDNEVYRRVCKAFKTLGIDYEYAEVGNELCEVLTTHPTERSKIDYILKSELQKGKMKNETSSEPFGETIS